MAPGEPPILSPLLLLTLNFTTVVAPTIDDVTPKGLRDGSFKIKIVRGIRGELAKINNDFKLSYEFSESAVKFKEPFQLRLDSSTDDQGKVIFIVNGGKKLIRAPRSGLNIRQDVSKQPGKRQTIFDFGLIAPSLFDNFMTAKFVRLDRATDHYVFDLSYVPGLRDRSRYRVWIDPEKKFTSKREWYGQDGRQMATFFYENPVKENGFWFPTKLIVKNADDKVAGISEYSGISLNQGIAESMFTIN